MTVSKRPELLVFGIDGACSSYIKQAVSDSICEVRTSYENHITGFAAEEARLTNKVVSIAEYEKSL